MKRNNKKRTVKIGLIQMSSAHLPELNLKKAIRKVEEAQAKGAKIVCLQELFKTDYLPQFKKQTSFQFAESIPGEATEIFSRLARKLGVVLIVPIFEKHSKRLYYNTAVLIDADGSILGMYRKTHLPNDPGYF